MGVGKVDRVSDVLPIHLEGGLPSPSRLFGPSFFRVQPPFKFLERSQAIESAMDRAARFLQLFPWEGGPSNGETIQAAVPFAIFAGISVALHVGAAVGISTEGELGRDSPFITEAKSELEKWQSNPQTPLGLGSFILRVETQLGSESFFEEDRKKIEEKWNHKLEDYKQAIEAAGPDSENQVKALIRNLYLDYTYHYGEDYPNMIDFIVKGRGQCYSQTKLVLAAFTGIGIKLPDHQILAVQTYFNHMQPVIYDYKTGVVWNLVTGEKTTKVTGPIYHAALFYQAFLQRRPLESSPVSAQDLLIREATDVEDRAFKPRTTGDKNFEFPENDIMFPGSAPKDHLLPPPVDVGLDEEFISETLRQTIHNENVATPSKLDPVNQGDPLDREIFHHLEALRTVMMEWPGELYLFGFTTNIKSHGRIFEVLLFRTEEEKEAYKTLTHPKMKRAFLLETIRRIETTSDFQNAVVVLSSPEKQLSEMNVNDLKEGISLIHTSASFLEGTSPEFGPFPSDLDDRDPRFFQEIISQSTVWDKIQKPYAAWQNWIRNHPKEFLVFLNHLPVDKKPAALFLGLKSLGPVYDLVKKQVQVTENKKKETPYDLPPPDIEIEVEVIDFPFPSAPTGPSQIISSPSDKGGPDKEDISGVPTGEIRISPETFLTLELFNVWFLPLWAEKEDYQKNYQYLQNRWNPELRDRFRKMNQKGDWIEILFDYMRAYNTSQRDDRSKVPPVLWPILDDMENQNSQRSRAASNPWPSVMR